MFGSDEAVPVPDLTVLAPETVATVLSCYADLEKKNVARVQLEPNGSMNNKDIKTIFSNAFSEGFRLLELDIQHCASEKNNHKLILQEAARQEMALILRAPASMFSEHLVDVISCVENRPEIEVIINFSTSLNNMSQEDRAAFKEDCYGVMRLVRTGISPKLVVFINNKSVAFVETVVNLAIELGSRGVAFEKTGVIKPKKMIELKKGINRVVISLKTQSMFEIELRGFPLDFMHEFNYMHSFGVSTATAYNWVI